MKIPFLDLKVQHQALKDEILLLWEEILVNASFVGGRHVSAFEEEFAELCNVRHCVSVGSGTDGLRLILLSLGLRHEEEVITVPNTFIATTEAISQAGGRPVFVDIDPDTYLMDPGEIERSVTPRTRGIIPVHLYGQMADMDPIMEIAGKHGLWVVEDACQAHLAEYKGCRAGSVGIAGAFSFYPGKNLGGCGEAGAVTTSDLGLAARVRMLRDHGQEKKYSHTMEGFNSRCDALQAAALRTKIKRLPEWNRARRKNAHRYIEALKDLEGIKLPKTAEGRLHVFHLFVIEVDDRDEVARELHERGIGTGLHYPVPLHLQQAYSDMGLEAGSYPRAESSAKRLLSLPMYPELTEAQIQYVCEGLRSILS
ncbi:MAG TPA: DegT/DnrJ/EryC1/StrS family aminotransferase [Desulfobacteraceae bacterium]|nr:DegT/DnrJ/EryC1/StrS family aminotransferase [Desulfobacteraceae bacterium]